MKRKAADAVEGVQLTSVKPIWLDVPNSPPHDRYASSPPLSPLFIDPSGSALPLPAARSAGLADVSRGKVPDR
jgi:hypothetical protein